MEEAGCGDQARVGVEESVFFDPAEERTSTYPLFDGYVDRIVHAEDVDQSFDGLVATDMTASTTCMHACSTEPSYK